MFLKTGEMGQALIKLGCLVVSSGETSIFALCFNLIFSCCVHHCSSMRVPALLKKKSSPNSCTNRAAADKPVQ